MRTFNLDVKLRDSLLFDDGYQPREYGGGIRRFTAADACTIAKLIAFGFLDPEDCQNDSPTAAEFLEFMHEHQGFLAHGYAVSPDRDDYRVTIEGIGKLAHISEEDREAFGWFRDADEYYCGAGECYCWYD